MLDYFEDEDRDDDDWEGPFVSQLEPRAGENYQGRELYIRISEGPMWRLELVNDDDMAEFVAETYDIEEDWDAKVPPEYTIEEVVAEEIDTRFIKAGFKLIDEGGNDYCVQYSSDHDKAQEIDLAKVEDVLEKLTEIGIEAVRVTEEDE